MTETSRVCGYLEKIYGQLNTDKFGGELEKVFITVQSTPKAYGHATHSKVWKTEDSRKYELNISAEYLDRPIENVVATMLHEMVHIYNFSHGIKDTSRGNTYHNRKFKEKAESVGLIIEHDSRIGWSITKPSEELLSYIADQRWTDIPVSRMRKLTPTDKSGNSTPDTQKKPSSTRKYICPRCGMSVRATKKVNIKCADCDAIMTTA